MKLTPEERDMLSPEEIATLEGADADTHLATMGDTVLPGETTPVAAAEVESDSNQDADETADATDGNEGSTTDAAPAQTEAAAEPAPAAQPKPQAFDVPDVAALDAQRKTLRTEKRDLTAKWSAGEVTDEEYADQIDALDKANDAANAIEVKTSW